MFYVWSKVQKFHARKIRIFRDSSGSLKVGNSCFSFNCSCSFMNNSLAIITVISLGKSCITYGHRVTIEWKVLFWPKISLSSPHISSSFTSYTYIQSYIYLRLCSNMLLFSTKLTKTFRFRFSLELKSNDVTAVFGKCHLFVYSRSSVEFFIFLICMSAMIL